MRTYIIRAGTEGPVKIGRAQNVQARLAMLQTGNHEELRILRIIAGDVEAGLHRQYSHLRIRGEWFRFDPSMLTAIPGLPPEVDEDLLVEYRKALGMPTPKPPRTIYLAEVSA